jgi:hypothetical protein
LNSSKMAGAIVDGRLVTEGEVDMAFHFCIRTGVGAVALDMPGPFV